MCTALTFTKKHMYFGRTLDNDFSYGEEIAVTPRNYLFRFRNGERMETHFAMVGMAFIPDEFPLYYDAVNEKGLCIAGLNFVGNAVYGKNRGGKCNLAQFELIPYLLGCCVSVKEAVKKLKNIIINDEPYNQSLPVAQLHWLIADKDRAVTIEYVKEGLKIHDNTVGVLTNNPPFEIQLHHLNDFMGLSAEQPKNMFSSKLKLKPYSRGMGAIGLPGDLSSQSRFIRAAFMKSNSVCADTEGDCLNQFFHLLGSVEQQRGCCIVKEGVFEYTVYSSCVDANKGIYYYTTYENHSISAIDMNRENLNGKTIARYPVLRKEQITIQNEKSILR